MPRPAPAPRSAAWRSWLRRRRCAQSAPPEVAELFARTRLEARHGAMFGTSDIRAEEARRLLERALPPA